MDTTRQDTERHERPHSGRLVVAIVVGAVVLSVVGPSFGVGSAAALDVDNRLLYIESDNTIHQLTFNGSSYTSHGTVAGTSINFVGSDNNGNLTHNDGTTVRWRDSDLTQYDSVSIGSWGKVAGGDMAPSGWVVVAGGTDLGTDHELRRYTNGSTEAWNVSFNGQTKDVDIPASGDYVYVAYHDGTDNYAMKVDAVSGNVEWDVKVSGGTSSMAIEAHPNDNFVVIGETGTAYKYNADGTQDKTAGLIESSTSLIVETDGISMDKGSSDVYIEAGEGSPGAYLYKFNSTFDQTESVQYDSTGSFGHPTAFDFETGSVFVYQKSGSGTDLEAKDTTLSAISEYDISGTSEENNAGMAIQSNPNEYLITGTVTDGDGEVLDGVTVSTNTSESDTTSGSGLYELSVRNGTYDVTAKKAGYDNVTKTVTVDGSSVIQDFTLEEINASLELDVKGFLKHGEFDFYEVTNTDLDTGSETDVTDQATVTSNDTDLLKVEPTKNQVVATANQSRTGVVAVTAEYDNKTATETIFVGNITVNNMDKLPPWGKFDAVLSSRVDGDGLQEGANATTLLLLVGAFAGAVFRATGSTYLGLTAFEGIVIVGWILGKTGNGVLLISLTAVGFVALNLAANIDYGVSRT